MQDSLYVALSSQVALERRLNTIADNVANSSTVGFRATGIKFEDVVSGTGSRAVSFASSGSTYLSPMNGGMLETGNPLDFAIQGDAWFAVATPAGTVMTRDGRFTLANSGALVTVEGHPVLDAGGAPIQLDPNDGPPVAGADGSLTQDGRLAGALGLFAFDPGLDFQRFGNSGLLNRDRLEPLVDTQDVGVSQGFVEQSNVNPMLEMMHLIQVQRTFENMSALIRDTGSSVDEAIKTLGSK
ncbi:flagellar basal-body rod protein FlgF [Aquamicrobium ahrensii]|uniref:Flagellar basal-body rod protein FlgF n=1 Tax=Aquamicrobium ahrensii TaxID=469551 RepID=A0ABV2KLJ6_9HYPH